jgi:imidazolonepropionase-like amidohydrolase/pimeloyl-ACP methyl ester carboxylesterase
VLVERPFESAELRLNLAAGPASGPPLLFLHGVARCWQDFLPLLSAFALRHRVYCLDFRGHGRSGRAPGRYFVADYVRDAVAALEQIGEPAVVYGHSLGAMVACGAAAAAPERVRGVVLEDPPFETLGTRIFETQFHALFAGMRRVAEGPDRPVAERAAELAEIRLPSGDGTVRLGDVRDGTQLRFGARCLERMDPAAFDPLLEGRWLEGFEEAELLPRVACPALLLAGDVARGGMLSPEAAGRIAGRLPGLHPDQRPRRGAPDPLDGRGSRGSLRNGISGIAGRRGSRTMKTAEGTTLIASGQLVDGTGGPAVADAAVLVRDGRIEYAGPAVGCPEVSPAARKIDARNGTIMPGLVEAHFHPTYFNVAALEDLDIKYPVEYVTLLAAANARLALECGYTAARSGGSLFNIDVWLKKAIEEDLVVGPRLAASGREICGVGGLMDWNPDFRKIGMEGLVLLVNGADEARAAVRKLVKDGVEWVKTYPTGDAAAPDTNDHHTLCMTFEEMNAVVQTAHNHRLKVTGHCRATEGIKNALRAGYDTLEHGTFMDDEALDLLLTRDVPVIPALQFELASIERGPEVGMPQAVIDGHQETLEGGAESARRILKAGGRLGMGGDYGFAWNPHGTYAKELTFFVNYVGFSALDTIKCATKSGAEIMGRGDEIGTIEAGKLADLLVVDGDVLADISLLEDRSRFIAVMQGGAVKAGQLRD